MLLLQQREAGSAFFAVCCNTFVNHTYHCSDRLCGLVVRVLATDPEVRVRFPALPHFLRSSVSGTGSTQPRELNWGAAWKKKWRLWSRNQRTVSSLTRVLMMSCFRRAVCNTDSWALILGTGWMYTRKLVVCSSLLVSGGAGVCTCGRLHQHVVLVSTVGGLAWRLRCRDSAVSVRYVYSCAAAEKAEINLSDMIGSAIALRNETLTVTAANAAGVASTLPDGSWGARPTVCVQSSPHWSVNLKRTVVEGLNNDRKKDSLATVNKLQSDFPLRDTRPSWRRKTVAVELILSPLTCIRLCLVQRTRSYCSASSKPWPDRQQCRHVASSQRHNDVAKGRKGFPRK
jgi:hypothetical protein